jgi:hypothetical protein
MDCHGMNTDRKQFVLIRNKFVGFPNESQSEIIFHSFDSSRTHAKKMENTQKRIRITNSTNYFAAYEGKTAKPRFRTVYELIRGTDTLTRETT